MLLVALLKSTRQKLTGNDVRTKRLNFPVVSYLDEVRGGTEERVSSPEWKLRSCYRCDGFYRNYFDTKNLLLKV